MLLGNSLGLAPELLATILNTSVSSISPLPLPLRCAESDCFISQTGKSWSSESNNPAPGATPKTSPPADRGYAPGFVAFSISLSYGFAHTSIFSFLSKLMAKGSLYFPLALDWSAHSSLCRPEPRRQRIKGHQDPYPHWWPHRNPLRYSLRSRGVGVQGFLYRLRVPPARERRRPAW